MIDATISGLRRRTRSNVLMKLYFRGPLSQHELKVMTGLSAATVSKVITNLIEERLVVQVGVARSTGGRPRTLLRVNPGYGHNVGVDIDSAGTRLRVVLFDLARTKLNDVEYPLSSRSRVPSKVAALIASGLREVTKKVDPLGTSILGIGVGVPGFVEQGEEPRIFSPVLGWDGVNLTRLLRAKNILWPIFLSSRAEALGHTEMLFGAPNDTRTSLVISVDSMVDAAFVTAEPTRSVLSISDWGHTTLVYNGEKCTCGARGCLQVYASATGILARSSSAGYAAPKMVVSERSRFTDLIKSASRSTLISRILEDAIAHLGAGIGSLVNILKPERVVLSGWAGLQLGGRFMPEIRAAAACYSLDYAFERTSFELGLTSVDDMAIGTITLPIRAFLERS